MATIIDFSYEPPRATGTVIFEDITFFEKLVSITKTLSLEFEIENLHLSEKEEEKIWEEKLNELGLTWYEVERYEFGAWSIQHSTEKRQSIHSTRFYKEGYMDFRL